MNVHLKSALALFLVSLPYTVYANPFAPIREDQVPAGINYNVTLPAVESPTLFEGKRVAILASHGVEETEITFPYAYLTQRGAHAGHSCARMVCAGNHGLKIF